MSSIGTLYTTSLSGGYIQEFILPSAEKLNELNHEMVSYETNLEKSPLKARFYANNVNEGSDFIIHQKNRPFAPTSLESISFALQLKPSRKWAAHESAILQNLYIPSADHLFTISRDGLVKEWNIRKNATKELLVSTQKHEELVGQPLELERSIPKDIQHSPTCMEYIVTEQGAELLAIGSSEKNILIYNLRNLTQPLEYSFKCKSGIFSLKSIDRGRKLIAGTNHGECYVFDLIKGEEIFNWKAHEGQITSFEFYRNTLFTSAQFDEKISIWDMRIQNESKSMGQMSGHTAPVWSIRQQNGVLYSAGADSSVCRWEWNNLRHYEEKFENMHEKNTIYSLEPLGGNFFASAGEDNTVRIFETKNGIQLAKLHTGYGTHSLQFVPSKENRTVE